MKNIQIKKELEKYVRIVINTIMDARKYNLKMCSLEFFKKTIIKKHVIHKILLYEKFEKTIIRIFKKILLYEKFEKKTL